MPVTALIFVEGGRHRKRKYTARDLNKTVTLRMTVSQQRWRPEL